MYIRFMSNLYLNGFLDFNNYRGKIGKHFIIGHVENAIDIIVPNVHGV